MQVAQIGQRGKAGVAFGRVCLFERPSQPMWDMHAETSSLDHGDDIGFERVADHQGTVGPVAMAGEDLGVNRGRFVRHDLDPVEKITKTGLGEFAFLIQEVALGDQKDAVGVGQRLDRVAGMGEEFDRMFQHLAPGGHEIGDDAGRDAAFGHFDGGFDHGEGKALHAKAVMPKVAAFGGEEAVMQVIWIGIIGQKRGETILRQAEEGFILPERVVGIKADGGDAGTGHGHSFSGSFACLRRGVQAGGGRRNAAHAVKGIGGPFPGAGLDYIHSLSSSSESLLPQRSLLPVSLTPVILSGSPEGPGNDSSVLTKTKAKTQRPPMYKVLLLNDDYTPMEFVVHVLERFFGMSHAQAFDIMLTVHKKGLAVVGVFSFEVAETKVAQVMDFSRRHQHPLQCTMEKE